MSEFLREAPWKPGDQFESTIPPATHSGLTQDGDGIGLLADRRPCQETALAAKRKPEPTFDVKPMESLQQMRRDDDEVYKSLRSICRGC